jgi:hypothetical protein
VPSDSEVVGKARDIITVPEFAAVSSIIPVHGTWLGRASNRDLSADSQCEGVS